MESSFCRCHFEGSIDDGICSVENSPSIVVNFKGNTNFEACQEEQFIHHQQYYWHTTTLAPRNADLRHSVIFTRGITQPFWRIQPHQSASLTHASNILPRLLMSNHRRKKDSESSHLSITARQKNGIGTSRLLRHYQHVFWGFIANESASHTTSYYGRNQSDLATRQSKVRLQEA